MARTRSQNKRSAARSKTASHKPAVASLPPCEGPKLSCFSERDRIDIEFIRKLSDPKTSTHSHVFEVRIDNKPYALKMFRFYRIEQDFVGMNDLQRSLIPEGELLYHFDPFHAECRAYGRLHEHKSSGRNVAVPAFGYLMLQPDLEKILEQRFQVRGWNRLPKEYDKSSAQRQPFRAIVKKMVYKKNEWNKYTTRKMLQDLLELRRMGIYNTDITADNYVGNQLADFSLAFTEPSMILDTKSRPESDMLKQRDLRFFDAMLEEEGFAGDPSMPNAWETYRYRTRLRTRNTPKNFDWD